MAAIPAGGATETETYSSGKHIDQDLITIYGSFELNGAANPINVKGRGFTVEYIDTGEFDIILSQSYQECVYLEANVGAETAGTVLGMKAECTPYVVSTKTFSINTFINDTGVDTEGDDDGPILYFKCVVRLEPRYVTNPRSA